MDITNLKNNHHLLVDYLCSNNYCKDIRWIIRRCIKTALKNGSLPQVTSYEDLFLVASDDTPPVNRVVAAVRTIFNRKRKIPKRKEA
jgi:hypothetical protein